MPPRALRTRPSGCRYEADEDVLQGAVVSQQWGSVDGGGRGRPRPPRRKQCPAWQ